MLTSNSSGCGPLGLLILAVAKAYGVRKVCMFDIEKSRTDFATSYGADSAFVPPKKEDGKDSLEYAQEYASKMIKELDVGNGFDVTGESAPAVVVVSFMKTSR